MYEPSWSSLSPEQAVERLREHISISKFSVLNDSCDRLNDVIVESALAYLQQGIGEMAVIRAALLDARGLLLDLPPHATANLPEGATQPSAWADRWAYLLGVLRRAEHAPSLAGGLRAIEEAVAGAHEAAKEAREAAAKEARAEVPGGRPEQVFRLIAEAETPLRPKDVATPLGMGTAAVSRALSRLREASLVSAIKAGKERHYSLTVRGQQLFVALKRGWPDPVGEPGKAEQPKLGLAKPASEGPLAEPKVYWLGRAS